MLHHILPLLGVLVLQKSSEVCVPLGEDPGPCSQAALLFFSFFFFFCFLGPHPQHMEVPRLGVELELLPPAYARVTATPDPRHVYNLHHSSRQHQILNPLSGARD